MVGANSLVDDMIGAVAVCVQDLQNAIDKIFHEHRAGPDIDYSANVLPCPEIVVHGAEEAVFSAAIDPGGANDVALLASFDYSFLALKFGFSINVNRPRLVYDSVWRPAKGFAVKYVLCAEVNDFRPYLAGRLRQGSRSINVYGLCFSGILLRLIDLDHCAVDNERGAGIQDAVTSGCAIGDIEIAVLQRQHFVVTSQSLRKMAGDKSCCACNQDFHRF